MAPVKYSYAKVRDPATLTEAEKARFVAWALVHYDKVSKHDWNAVAEMLGAASANSACVCFGRALKKLREGAAESGGDDDAPATPTVDNTSGGNATSTGKKRKSPAKKKDGENGTAEGSPAKKPRKPRAKKDDTPQSVKSEGDLESMFNITEASTIMGETGFPSEGLFDFEGGDMQYPE